MTLAQFVKKWTGKKVPNNHGGYVGECVSLATQFAQNVLGVPNADAVLYCSKTGGARDLYEQFNGQIPHYFTRVPASKPAQINDLVVWGKSVGSYGHVAIYTGVHQIFSQDGTPYFNAARTRSMIPGALGYLRRRGAPKPAAAPPVQAIYYTVVAGDTVGAICKRFGVTLAQFAARNPTIKDLNKIYVGQKVRIA